METKSGNVITPQLALAELGYSVFPIFANAKKPLTLHGLLDATTDAEQIERWTNQYKGCNWAVRTNGLLVVDIDPTPEGVAPWLADDPDKLLELAAGPMAITPRQGRHYWLRQPPGAELGCTQSELASGVDTRANGGYVLVPPSSVDGKAYRWISELDTSHDQLPLPPQWLLDQLAKKPQRTGQQTTPDKIPSGQRNGRLFKLACALRRPGLSQDELAAALKAINLARCEPPLEDRDVERIAQSAAKYDPDADTVAKIEGAPTLQPRSMKERLQVHTGLRTPVVHGLVRQGETMNVIAQTKIGKSWLAYSLALAIISGKRWLESFLTEPGKVLLIDNELHDETIADRIPRVAEALEIGQAEYGEQFDVLTLRGRLKDLASLSQEFASFKPGQYSCIILDSLYRAMPPGKEENSNPDFTAVYNLIDNYAMQSGAAIVLIHHTTKGNQADKSVTDAGAGAGAIARAPDTQIVMREHEEPGVVVMEAVVRSWPPVEPICLRWEFPLWKPVKAEEGLDPKALRRTHSRKPKEQAKKWTAQRSEERRVWKEWEHRRRTTA